LPASHWKLSEREFLKPFLSIGDAIRILIMICNNPATSGVDMSPELLVRMLETIDNLTMVKGCTGDLSRMQRIDQLSGGWLPFYNGINPLVLDALQAGTAGWCTAGPCLRPQPCIDLYGAEAAGELPRAQAIYAELLPLLEFVVAGGPATTAEAGLGLLGVGVGDPSRPLAPLDDEGRVALKKLLTDP
jgi:4-hydroxy-tetrahydrodipicolinate synthase